MKILAMGALLATIGAAGVLTTRSVPTDRGPSSPTPPALGASAGPASLPVLLVAPGVTEPRSRTIEVSSELAGVIRAVHVTAGDQVRAGDVIAELDDEVQRHSVALAEAAVDRACAELDRLVNGERPGEQAVARAMLDEAEANLGLAEFESTHFEELQRQNAVSAREFMQVRTSLGLARARREAAFRRWKLIAEGPREEDIARGRAVLREAEARLASAMALLDKTRIRAPIDGTVIYRFCEPGESVHAGAPMPIISLGDCSRMHVRVDVDESDINEAWVGQPVYATADAYGNQRFAGRVVHLEPTLGRKNFRTQRPTELTDTRIREVVIELDDASDLPVELQMVVWFVDAGRSAIAQHQMRPL